VGVNGELALTFRQQHGVATAVQAQAAGVPRWQLRTLVRRGLLDEPLPGILTLAPATPTWRRRAMIATLATHPEAALSHGSAARLLGFDGFDRYPEIHVTVPHGLRPTRAVPPRVSVHQTRHWGADDTVVRDAIRVRTAPLTLIDLCATMSRAVTSKALDGVLREGVDVQELQHVVAGRVRRGRRGPQPLLALLDEKTNRRLPRSWFQRLASAALSGRGLRFEDEFPVHDDRGVLLAELDLAIPSLMIGVECQSWRWHSTPSGRAWDSTRKRQLRRMGWEIVEVWWADLRRIDEVAATLRVVITDRRAHLPAQLDVPDA
jgi:hypothetical protein